MPIYEYQCTDCGHHLEAIQKMSDPLLTECPICQKSTLSKQISAAGFQLKGTGWYATDFKDKGKKTDTKPSTKKTETKDTGGGDTTSSSSTTDSKN